MELRSVSVDRLTFVGGITDKQLLQTLDHNPFVKGMGRAKYPYDYTWYMMDGSVLQLAAQGTEVRPLRYDFNPKNWKSEYAKDRHIMSILRLMKDVSSTRLDIAMDIIGEDLGKHTWIDSQSRARELHVDGVGNLETLYIGGAKSNERFRIYNKKKEREVRKEMQIDLDHWWRVEVQLRSEKAENWFSENPYRQVYCVNGSMRDVILTTPYDISTKAMLFYLSSFPEELPKLAQNTRLKYKNLIGAFSEHMAPPGESSFFDVYEKAKPTILDEIMEWRNCTEKGIDWSAGDDQDQLDFIEKNRYGDDLDGD